jgi:hypothetical protein
MKLKNFIFSIIVGLGFSYAGVGLQKQIEKRLRQQETSDPSVGASPRTIFWLRLIDGHKNNLPYILGILGILTSTATIQFNKGLAEYLYTTTFSCLYEQINFNNLYLKVIEQRRITNKFLEANSLMQALALTPNMTPHERMDGFKLILADLLSCDTKKKLRYSTFALGTLLIYLFTGNFLVFTHMIWALIQLIKEGKISRAVGKTLIMLLSKKGIPIPEELEDIVSE